MKRRLTIIVCTAVLAVLFASVVSAASPPAASTGAASSIGTTSARLNGSVDPNGRATTYFFEYGTTTSYGARTSSSSAGSGTVPVSVSKAIGRLTPGTTYHFRLVATSNAGTVAGSDRTFATLSPPAVTTGPASNIGPTTATISGSINPNGRPTSYFVQYGVGTQYGFRTPSQSAGSGSSAVNVTVNVSGLQIGMLYHYRLVASSSLGTTRGADATFTTSGPPAATTGPVTFTTLSLFSTRVAGTVNPRGAAATAHFEYGRTPSYGLRTAEIAIPAGTADVPIEVRLTGLAPGRRYHYRVVATSALGTSVGRNASFATPPPPVGPDGKFVHCTIAGTQASDVLRGGPGRDVICGLGGDDRIFGGGGDDIIYGGPGQDVLDGGAGNDVLRGGSGNDELLGRSGNDRLEGGLGNDRLVGGTGRDRLFGGPGGDTIFARDGFRDIVDGGLGTDVATVDRGLDVVGYVEHRR